MPSNERSADMFSRVRMMASGHDAWDLSDKDIAALEHVLAAAEAREGREKAGVGVGTKSIQAVETTSSVGGVEATQPTALPTVSMGCTVMSDNTTTQPTAAEVIRVCEEAFRRIYWDHEEAYEMERETKEPMDLIARWKEAQGGKP